MVLTRAFACALPAVASDIPGYREVLEPAASVAVPPDDPDALVDAVEGLVSDEPRRARDGGGGAGSRDRALLVAAHRQRLVEVYEDVTGRSEREVAPAA